MTQTLYAYMNKIKIKKKRGDYVMGWRTHEWDSHLYKRGSGELPTLPPHEDPRHCM
jgi:hypothetical protein